MVYYVAAIVLIAFVFDFINGFHDSANSIARHVEVVQEPSLGRHHRPHRDQKSHDDTHCLLSVVCAVGVR